MKLIKLIIVITILNVSHHAKAQLAFDVGYQYLGRNALHIGIDAKVSNKTPINIGVDVVYTRVNGNNKIIPQVHFDYILYEDYLLFGGINLNTYAIEPKIGFNFFNVATINTGYAFPIHKNKYFRGITFGLSIKIDPVSGGNYYYHIH